MIPGTIQANIQISRRLHDAMRKIQAVRSRHAGSTVKLCQVYADAAELLVSSVDPKTGLLRREPQQPPQPQQGAVVLTAFPIDPEIQSESALFEAMDQSWMMLWACDPEGLHLHANPVLLSYVGRSAGSFVNGGWADLLHPEDKARTLLAASFGLQSLRPFRLAYRMRRRDGAYGRVEDLAQPWLRPEGEKKIGAFVGTMYDVSMSWAVEFDSIQ